MMMNRIKNGEEMQASRARARTLIEQRRAGEKHFNEILELLPQGVAPQVRAYLCLVIDLSTGAPEIIGAGVYSEPPERLKVARGIHHAMITSHAGETYHAAQASLHRSLRTNTLLAWVRPLIAKYNQHCNPKEEEEN